MATSKDNVFTPEDEETLRLLNEEEATGSGSDDGKPSDDGNGTTPLILGKYRSPEDVVHAFLSQQAETTRLIQKHQQDLAERDKELQRLRTEREAPPPPVDLVEQALSDQGEPPDMVDDPDGYQAWVQQRTELLAERRAKTVVETTLREQRDREAKSRQEAELRERQVDMAARYIEKYHPGKMPNEIPELTTELSRWADYGQKQGIEDITTARELFELRDPATQRKRVKAELEKMRNQRMSLTREGRKDIREGLPKASELRGLTSAQLAARAKRDLGLADY